METRIGRFVQKRAAVGAFLALVSLYLFFTIFGSLHKRLWFDEFGTLFVASAPTWKDMFQRATADANPPLFYSLIRVSVQLIGLEHNALAIRLPGMLAMVLGAACIFLFLRRTCRASVSLIGAGLLLTGPVLPFPAMDLGGGVGAEGRPYAMLIGLTALALLLWQRLVFGERRRPILFVALAATIAATTLVHTFGVFYIAVPLFTAEFVRILQRRRLDWPLYAAILIGFVPLLLTIPMGIATRTAVLQGMPPQGFPEATPARGRLLGGYTHLFFFFWYFLLIVLALVSGTTKPGETKQSDPQESSPPSAAEIAAAMAMVSLVLISWLIARFGSHYYHDRYAAGATLGVALCFGFLSRAIVWTKTIAVSMLLWFLIATLGNVVKTRSRSADFDSVAFAKEAPKDFPLVISRAFDFPQMWWYFPAGERQRLHLIADRESALKLYDAVPELYLIRQDRYNNLPFHLDNYREFVAQYPTFYLYVTSNFPPGSWVPETLKTHGYRFTVLQESGKKLPRAILYRVDRPKN